SARTRCPASTSARAAWSTPRSTVPRRPPAPRPTQPARWSSRPAADPYRQFEEGGGRPPSSSRQGPDASAGEGHGLPRVGLAGVAVEEAGGLALVGEGDRMVGDLGPQERTRAAMAQGHDGATRAEDRRRERANGVQQAGHDTAASGGVPMTWPPLRGGGPVTLIRSLRSLMRATYRSGCDGRVTLAGMLGEPRVVIVVTPGEPRPGS